MTSTNGAFLGMGNPLLDISADVPKEFLAKYDVKLNNAILCEEKHEPMYKDMVDQFKVQYIAGGATQNSIRVAQWMLQQAGATAYIGCVGKDAYGEQLAKSAGGDGVNVCYLEDEKTPTGTCAVLINEHERSLIANLAAANNYKVEHLDEPKIKEVWEKAQFYYSAGFFLTVSPAAIMKTAEHALANKKMYAMNLSAPFIPQFFKDPLAAALPYCGLLFGNESEAEAFATANGWDDCKTTEAVAKKACALPCKVPGGRMVVFTQGAEETIVVVTGKVTKYAVPAIAKEEMVDVNGAGDAFVGGFMAKLIEGKSIDEAVAAGHYAAGYIIRRSGCVLEGKPSFTFSA